MPEFKQNRGYKMKGTDLYDKVQKPNGNGFYMKKKGDTDPKKVKQDAKEVESTHKGTSEHEQEGHDWRAGYYDDRAKKYEKMAEKSAGTGGEFSQRTQSRANIERETADKYKEEAERKARLSKGSGKAGPYER